MTNTRLHLGKNKVNILSFTTKDTRLPADQALFDPVYAYIYDLYTDPPLLSSYNYIRWKESRDLDWPVNPSPKFTSDHSFPSSFPTHILLPRTSRQSHPPSVHHRRAVLSRALCSFRSLDWGCVASLRAVHTSRGGENGSIAGVASRLPVNDNDYDGTQRETFSRFDKALRLRLGHCSLVVVDRRTDGRPVDDCAPRGLVIRGSVLWQAASSGRLNVAEEAAAAAATATRCWQARTLPRTPENERRERRRLFSLHAASRRNPARVHRALSCACHLSSKLNEIEIFLRQIDPAGDPAISSRFWMIEGLKTEVRHRDHWIIESAESALGKSMMIDHSTAFDRNNRYIDVSVG